MDMVSPRAIFGGRKQSTNINQNAFLKLQTLETAHRKHPEHRRNLLYESHPAVTQVDGQPRAPSSTVQVMSDPLGTSRGHEKFVLQLSE